MANPFDIRDFNPDKRWISSNPYRNLALANDTMGLDRDSIENDLWVNIVDVVILVSLTKFLGLADVLQFSHVCMAHLAGVHHYRCWKYLNKHVVAGTSRKRGNCQDATCSRSSLFGFDAWVRRSVQVSIEMTLTSSLAISSVS